MESFDDGTKVTTSGTVLAERLRFGRRGAWLVTLLFLVLSGAALGSGLEPREVPGGPGALPDSADSTTVQNALDALPATGQPPAVVVLTRDGESLRATDADAVNALAGPVGAILGEGAAPTLSDDGSVGLLTVPLAGGDVEPQIDQLREALPDLLPGGVTADVTGGPAFQTDLADVFAGADVRLLIATASVVALLLLVTYRSPWLWLVPLIVVAIGDRVAVIAVAAATQIFDYKVDGSTVGITSVLVFGAGTNYALLLIARYREELRRVEDRCAAMAIAWRSTAAAVVASGGTVILALLMLSFADTPSTRALGWSAALGVGVAVIYGLVALPAVLLLFGRRLFWPFVPRVGQPDPAESGAWARIGARVVAQPVRYLTVAVLIVAVLAAGLSTLKVGLTQNERFRDVPEAVVGQERLAEGFPAGAAEPTVILTSPDRVAEIIEQVEGVPGVADVRPSRADGDTATVQVVLNADRGSDAARTTIKDLRSELGDSALVGGPDAQDLDASDAAARDRAVIFPLVVAVVVIVLLVLLRSVVAALVLVTTVVATYAAALGAGAWATEKLFGFPALDLTVPLFAFVFLVALGVDYNIFLATRAREEAVQASMARAMTRALAVTGGVITSAGILLAAVFAVLGVLPLVTLTQIGVIVGLGVLIDTLIVRTVIVPTLATVLGERFWWPRHPGGATRTHEVAVP